MVDQSPSLRTSNFSLHRLGFVKLKGTISARKFPDDFNKQKDEFIRSFGKARESKHHHPSALLTDVNLITGS